MRGMITSFNCNDHIHITRLYRPGKAMPPSKTHEAGPKYRPQPGPRQHDYEMHYEMVVLYDMTRVSCH